MVAATEEEQSLENIAVEWPVKGWTFAHVKNVEYALELLRKCARITRNPVVGFFLMRGFGTRDMYHRVLSKSEAERLRGEDDSFAYETIHSLLKAKNDIEHGVYRVRNGLIVGLNPDYTPTEKPYRSRK